MFAIMIRSLIHDARAVRRGDRDRRDEVGLARPDAAHADHVAGFYVAGGVRLPVGGGGEGGGRPRLAGSYKTGGSGRGGGEGTVRGGLSLPPANRGQSL